MKEKKNLNKRKISDSSKITLMNYITEIDEQSILAFSLIKLQTTQTNPEPRTIGVQKEKEKPETKDLSKRGKIQTPTT